MVFVMVLVMVFVMVLLVMVLVMVFVSYGREEDDKGHTSPGFGNDSYRNPFKNTYSFSIYEFLVMVFLGYGFLVMVFFNY